MTSPAILRFRKPGLLTTIQDRGREGYRHLGVAPGGWLDRKSAEDANALVGNHPNTPMLEITISGPEIEFLGAQCRIAITGADISPHLDGNPIPTHQGITVQSGQVLTFGKLRSGCRAYLAVGGNWEVDTWLGSAAAFLQGPGSILPGSVAAKGREIRIDASGNEASATRLHPRGVSRHMPPYSVRVLPGPEYNQFGREALECFLTQSHTASNDCSRMGIRLAAPLPGACFETGLISTGVIPGTIQVTPSGQCIILLRDAQTTGGYPRIANVISADMDTLAQVKPGDTIRFDIVNKEKI